MSLAAVLLGKAAPDPAWATHPDRPCEGRWDDWFDPSEAGQQARAADCTACPVRTECLDHALEQREMHGVWGGTTERERRQMIARRRQTARLAS